MVNRKGSTGELHICQDTLERIIGRVTSLHLWQDTLGKIGRITQGMLHREE
jgi:Co/Zn/Cd efflux system component